MVTTRRTEAKVTTASLSPVNKFFKRIPTRFVKLQGSKLSEVVTLETPAGFKRSIKLKRIGEEIWFQEGWSEFAEAHFISEGHFLFLEYKGNSSFRVMIFDASACEIEYPLDEVRISDSDDEVIDVTDEGVLGTQGTRGNDQSVKDGNSGDKLKKRPRDDEFEKILNDVDGINSLKVLEEEEVKRHFRGKQFF